MNIHCYYAIRLLLYITEIYLQKNKKRNIECP